MDTRAIGRTLEQKIVNKFLEIGIKASLSKNSGCSGYNLGDINADDWIVECKLKNTESITLDSNVWKKLVESVPLHSKRKAMYVLENKEKQIWCVLSLDDMFDLIKNASQKT
jgi:Holliday junction resolvase